MPVLTGGQRKYLRGLAHGKKPLVLIGKNGLTESLFVALDEALESHELIKVMPEMHEEIEDKIPEALIAD